MTASLHSLHTPAPLAALHAAQDALRAVVRGLRLRIQVWQRRRRARQAVRALAELDVHTLRDLGIDRSELLSCAYDPADRTRVRALVS